MKKKCRQCGKPTGNTRPSASTILYWKPCGKDLIISFFCNTRCGNAWAKRIRR